VNARRVARAIALSISGSSILTFAGPEVNPHWPPHLAEWLDDPAAVHPCNGEVSLHGFELMVGLVQSALDNVKVELPVEVGEAVLERMAARL